MANGNISNVHKEEFFVCEFRLVWGFLVVSFEFAFFYDQICILVSIIPPQFLCRKNGLTSK